MKKIYKYELSLIDKQAVTMPAHAQILTVQAQHGGLYVWALIDMNNTLVSVPFYIVGTGNSIPNNVAQATYLTTVQMSQFVWHIFYEK